MDGTSVWALIKTLALAQAGFKAGLWKSGVGVVDIGDVGKGGCIDHKEKEIE